MKIRDIITEGKRKDATKTGNDKAMIVHTSKEAGEAFDDAEKGSTGDLDSDDARSLLDKVADMYGVEYVEDFFQFAREPHDSRETDKQESLLSNDMRK